MNLSALNWLDILFLLVFLSATSTLLTVLFLRWRLQHSAQKLTQPSSWHFVEVQGLNIHYFEQGQGQPLILLHGIGASLYIWRKLIPYLSKQFRVICVDLPGFGQSDKPSSIDYGLDAQSDRLLGFTEALGLDQAYLVGSSMGGAIALWLSHRYPERFTKVAVLAPAVSPRLVPVRVSWIQSIAGYFQFLLQREFIALICARAIARYPELSREELDAYWAPYAADPNAMRAFLKATDLIRDPRLGDLPQQLSGPTLVLVGDNDRVIPAHRLRSVFSDNPNAILNVHPDGGHHLMEDEPEWCAQEILKFLSAPQ